MELKLAKYNRDCWRIEDESGIVRYMALALTNGRWSLVDAEDRRVTRKTFPTPQEVYDEAMSIARLSRDIETLGRYGFKPRFVPDKASKA